MTAAAKSVFYFGFYLYATGLALIFIPNKLLTAFQLPETTEVWIRVVGVLVLLIGFYYHQMGKQNFKPFYSLTVIARTVVCISFICFVLLKFVSPMIIPFGVIDLLGAVWTFFALKKAN
jgi:steroid 5-alpha reductase family enzyme